MPRKALFRLPADLPAALEAGLLRSSHLCMPVFTASVWLGAVVRTASSHAIHRNRKYRVRNTMRLTC